MSTKPAIGIDLGTTSSVVAVSRSGVVKIIANEQWNRRTPSYVAFTYTERLVGDSALFQAHRNPENTIYGVKRFIGRDFDDPEVLRDIKGWPFSVFDENDEIKIRVMYKGEEKVLYPEEVSAAVLGNLRATAKAYLREKVSDVVITVPAYFNNSQRIATAKAAEIAGLNVIRMINEPTAAAIAYADKLLDYERGRKNVLIYDFGRRFDVSILLMKGKKFTVRSVEGDPHLGGDNFDTLMMKHFAEEFEQKYGFKIRDNMESMRNLKTHCERIKRLLSSYTHASFTLEDTIIEGTMTRARFEDLCNDLFENSMCLVAEALKEGEMTKEEIDDVIMIGGSSRIPRIQELLQEFFKGKPIHKSINFEECVAYGAAVQAALLQDS